MKCEERKKSPLAEVQVGFLFGCRVLEFFDFYVAEPDLVAVVLKADVAGFGHFAECAVEFVARAVGVLVRRGPAVEVHVGDLLAV